MTHPQPDGPPSFAIGDVVRLKSGGPAMTVHFVVVENDSVECCWFTSDGTFGDMGFGPSTIVLATTPAAAATSEDIVVTGEDLGAGVAAFMACNEGHLPEVLAKAYHAMETERRRGEQP